MMSLLTKNLWYANWANRDTLPVLYDMKIALARYAFKKGILPLLLLLLLLLLLFLSLFSQSLRVFFLSISRAQTMHLERQSLTSIILFIH